MNACITYCMYEPGVWVGTFLTLTVVAYAIVRAWAKKAGRE